MNKTYFFLIVLASLILGYDQTLYSQDCLWSSHAGGTEFDGAGYIVSDRFGNTYIDGGTKSSPCYFGTDTLGDCRFIVKYDVNGNVQWKFIVNPSTGPNDGETGNLSIVIDSIHDRLLVSGTFYGTLGLPDTILTGQKNTIFLLSMDFNGNVIWYNTAGGAGDDQAFDITCDHDGNIYINGSNETEATFGQITIPRGGFLAKYDENGNVVWARNKFRFFNQFGSGSGFPYTEADSKRILYTSNSVFVYGAILNDTTVFDTVIIIHPIGYLYQFLASYNNLGDLNWVRLEAGPESMGGLHIATDNLGHIFTTGTFDKTGIFGNDTLISPGYSDCYLAKYDENGNLNWVTTTNSSISAYGSALASSSDGTVYLSGVFHGTALFGNTMLTSSAMDMFLARYAADGTNIGVRQYSTGGINGLALDGSNNICLTGSFSGTLNIGPNTFVSYGGSDLFAAKCSPIISGIELLNAGSNQLLIYANPNSGVCNITIPEDFKNEKSLTLTIFDSQGKVIQKVPVEISSDKISLDIRGQATGMYNVILTNGKKNYTGKIIFK